jgi:hypothetical protein
VTATIPEIGMLYGLDDPTYRAAPGLSSTGVKLMLDSPAKYRWTMDHPTGTKTAFDLGIAVHAEILGEGLEVEVLDYPGYTTKAAREARDDVRRQGKIPLLTEQWEQVRGMRDAILAHDDARTLLELPGDSEVSCFWTDPYTGVPLKGRFDRLASSAPILIDLKSTAMSARPSSLRAYAGETHRFIHVVAETTPPHLVSVDELDQEFLTIAEERRRHAIDDYARCIETGDWPGFAPGIARVQPPRWYGLDDLEEVV